MKVLGQQERNEEEVGENYTSQLTMKVAYVAKKAPELAPLLHCTEVFRLGRKRELILAKNYFDSLVSLNTTYERKVNGFFDIDRPVGVVSP